MYTITNILMILDRSGSMETIRKDTIGGINTFIRDQKKESGKTRFTLVQFDHEYETVCSNKILDEVELFDETSFVPRGSTALLDAVGRSINDFDARIAKMADDNKPHKIVVVIITDGQENCSKEFKRDTIKKLIESKEKSEDREWHFIYLGANQDSFSEAGSIGIAYGSTSNYCCSSADISDKYLNVSRLVKSHISGTGPRNFTDDERKTK